MKKTTKIVMVGGIIAMGMATAQAQSFGPGTASAAKVTFTVTTGNFVQNAFSFSLSNGVSMNANDNNTAFAVSAANSKGTRAFGGSTAGGSVRDCDGSSVASPAPKAATAGTDGCS
jgi:hypothetical protein